jgi:hypothetical protein
VHEFGRVTIEDDVSGVTSLSHVEMDGRDVVIDDGEGEASVGISLAVGDGTRWWCWT